MLTFPYQSLRTNFRTFITPPYQDEGFRIGFASLFSSSLSPGLQGIAMLPMCDLFYMESDALYGAARPTLPPTVAFG